MTVSVLLVIDDEIPVLAGFKGPVVPISVGVTAGLLLVVVVVVVVPEEPSTVGVTDVEDVELLGGEADDAEIVHIW